MTGVEAALAAMDTAEQEARDHLDGDDPQDVEFGEWASDRLRLIQRDRATLERHHPAAGGHDCWCGNGWTDEQYERRCPDAQAVVACWTQENA